MLGADWHRLLPSPRLLLALTPGPRCLPLEAQPASALSLKSSHGQQEQRLGVCGPGAEEVLRASLHSQACPLGRWRVWGLGEALKDPQSGHCQPADPQRRHREPQCPGAHLAPFTGTVPIHTGTRPAPWGGGRMSFYLLSSQLC